jgi:hypothetical protein
MPSHQPELNDNTTRSGHARFHERDTYTGTTSQASHLVHESSILPLSNGNTQIQSGVSQELPSSEELRALVDLYFQSVHRNCPWSQRIIPKTNTKAD